MLECISPRDLPMEGTDRSRNTLSGVVEISEFIGQAAWVEHVTLQTDEFLRRLMETRYGSTLADMLEKFTLSFDRTPSLRDAGVSEEQLK